MYYTFTNKKRGFSLLGRLGAALLLIVGLATVATAQSTNPSPYGNANYTNNPQVCPTDWAGTYERVTFGLIDFTGPVCPGHARGNYSYWTSGSFPSLTTSLTKGSSFAFSTTISTITNTNGSFAAWIDWNRDNDFADAGEFVVSTVNVPNSGIKIDRNITIPCGAGTGLTRLRLRHLSSLDGTLNSGNSVGALGWGETFDFDLTLANPSNPTANYFLPDTIFTNSPATFINANQTGYSGHAWSTTVGGLTTIVGTGVNFTFSFPASGTYQVRLTSTNCIGSATVTKNITVVDPVRVPTVRFLASRNYIPLAANDLVVDEQVAFSDFSTSGPTGYQWEITPGAAALKFWFASVGTLTSKNVTIFFTDTAKYEVCLTASNAIGSSKLCKKDYVVIEYPSSSSKFENNICEDLRSGSDSGFVYDPGGRNAVYPNGGGTCQFVIDACDAESIDVTLFSAGFGVSFNDFLRIFDGPDITSPLLFQIGNNTGLPANRTFTARSGKVTVEFQRDAFNNGPGFQLFWRARPRNDGPIDAQIGIIDRLSNDTIYNCAAKREVRFSNATRNTRFINKDNPEDIQWIFDFDPNIAYPPGFEDAPDNADEVNPIYEYNTSKTYRVRLVVRSCEGWDTAIRTFHLRTTTMAPIVSFTADDNILTVNGTTTLRNRTVAWCSGEWTISPGTYTILNGGTTTNQDITVRFTAAGRYTVKYTATNDNGTSSRTLTDFIRVIDYCNPTVGTSIQSMSISRVRFETINNTSLLGTNGYQSYIGNPLISVPDLFIGGTYPIEVQRNSVFDLADRKVWIDFDRDGIFTATEQVAGDLNQTTSVLNANITIPDISIVTPGLTRMRVAIAFSGKPFTSCGPIDVGEYEDYQVNLRRDDVPPVITMLGKDTIYIERNTRYIDPSATALDNREGNITSRIVTNNQVDSSQNGIYLVTYNVTDGSGIAGLQRTRYVFVVQDLTAPVLTVRGSTTQIHDVNTTYSDSGATAVDNPGAVNITNFVIADNKVNDKQLGTYDVNYSVTDAYGNRATGKRTVTVVDRLAPVINAVGGNPMNVQVNAPFNDPTTVSDNFWKNVSLTVVSGSVNTSVFGQYKITYGATDGSGNTAAPLTRTYNVTDLIPPVLSSRTGSEFIVAEVNDLKFTEPAVEGKDNYFPTVNIIRTGNYDITKLGDYTITYTGTDGAGNSATYIRTIRVVDNNAPVVISNPANVQRWTVFNALSGVSTIDNYWAPSTFCPTGCPGKIEIISSNVNMLQEGLYQVIYQAVDGSGNISVPHLRLVNVVSNTTGVSENALGQSISIYPNPTNGKFEVSFSTMLSSDATISIMNSVGQLISTYAASEIANNKLSVDMSNHSAGIYFVHIQNNGSTTTKKVTVSR